jgi:hypothetical protein
MPCGNPGGYYGGGNLILFLLLIILVGDCLCSDGLFGRY